jgi:hypothetical protein
LTDQTSTSPAAKGEVGYITYDIRLKILVLSAILINRHISTVLVLVLQYRRHSYHADYYWFLMANAPVF